MYAKVNILRSLPYHLRRDLTLELYSGNSPIHSRVQRVSHTGQPTNFVGERTGHRTRMVRFALCEGFKGFGSNHANRSPATLTKLAILSTRFFLGYKHRDVALPCRQDFPATTRI